MVARMFALAMALWALASSSAWAGFSLNHNETLARG
jgi:hypothetical protein